MNKLKQLISTYSIFKEQYASISKLQRYSSALSRIKGIKEAHIPNPSRALDIGCGPTPQNTFEAKDLFGIDVAKFEGDVKIEMVDLAIDPMPFADAFFDAVTAHDFIEHVPRVIYTPERKNSFVDLMSEVYRILAPGGLFLSKTPFYPMSEAFADPTHVNFISATTFETYFCDAAYARNYGFKGNFEQIDNFISGVHLFTILKKC